MRRWISALGLSLALLLPALATAVEAPRADARPKILESHGKQRVDEYYWLNQRDDPEVLAYLEAENAYTREQLKPTNELRDELYEEIVGRIDPTDESVPVFENGYWYYSRYLPGQDYELRCRKKGSLDADEEIMLDGNRLAEGFSFFSLRGGAVSSGNDLVAYAVDTVGRRKYSLRIRDLTTGTDLPDQIPDIAGNFVWAMGQRVLFYTRQDPQTLRWYQVWRHEVGTDPASDVLVYQEDDETFEVSVDRTKSRSYLTITSEQTLATEVRYLRSNDPMGEWRVFAPRERGHEYSVEHAGDRFLVRTNWQAQNFKLMEVSTQDTARENWTDVIPHRADVLFEGFEVFANHLVVRERRGGLQHLRVIPSFGEVYEVEFHDPTYSIFIGNNPEYDSTVLRYGYSSLTTPTSIYDYDLSTGEQVLKKRSRVLGGFDTDDYESQYLWGTAEDGTRVPISLVYRKDRIERGTNPLLLYSYGSYGSSSGAWFSSPVLSLLDRGWVYAIAHIRGGQEMGRSWYEQGKLLHKKNTFTDFIDCARFLAEERWGDRERMYCVGGSAGGLLVGAVVNMAPGLFDGAVARVPFVDVVTTMLDESIPLTTAEFDEWGNPTDPEYYDYMLSYSPYDNVAAQDYPNMLVTTSLHDSQVQYFEPAKWVARLRARKTDDHLLLLDINMEAGHGGASGRLSRHRETAKIYAFLLYLAAMPQGS